MSAENLRKLIEKTKLEIANPKLPEHIRVKKEERLFRLEDELHSYTRPGDPYCTQVIDDEVWYCAIVKVGHKHEFYIPFFNTRLPISIMTGLVHIKREEESTEEPYSKNWFAAIYNIEISGQELYDSYKKYLGVNQ